MVPCNVLQPTSATVGKLQAIAGSDRSVPDSTHRCRLEFEVGRGIFQQTMFAICRSCTAPPAVHTLAGSALTAAWPIRLKTSACGLCMLNRVVQPHARTDRCKCRPARFRLELFLDTCCSTRQTAQIVELCTTYRTASLYLNFSNQRAVGLKHTFNTFTVRDFSHCER